MTSLHKNLLQLLFTFAAIIAFNSGFAQLNCKDFKYGKFEIVDQDIKHRSVIERYDDIQEETDLGSGHKAKFRIIWINDCEYTLKFLESSQEEDADFKDLELRVKILSTKANEYTFEAVIDKVNFKATNTMRRIK